MSWNATLNLDYTRQQEVTIAHFQHDGPLRILQSLYPEGKGICHNILVHPPGGLVGGDTLDVKISVGPGAHGLITTPGATRFYRSDGEKALQRTEITLKPGARMEWLPLEALCYSGCVAENRLSLNLDENSELIGWDVLALGLPAAGKSFEKGTFCQHLEIPGAWLERAHIRASDNKLLRSPMGLAGHNCLATLFFTTGSKLEKSQRQQVLDTAREIIGRNPLCATAAATSPDARIVVVRVMAPVVEPAMALLREIWQTWRSHIWHINTTQPRIWST